MADLTIEDLRRIAAARLRDARALLRKRRFDGGVYLCGYAIEMALKARICKTLGWRTWPEGGEYRTFKTHDLDILLNLTGREMKIRTRLPVEWSIVAEWNPESRYAPIGGATETNLNQMIAATTQLLKALR